MRDEFSQAEKGGSKWERVGPLFKEEAKSPQRIQRLGRRVGGCNGHVERFEFHKEEAAER